MPLRFRVLPADDARPGAGASGPLVERAVELPDALDEIRVGRRADVELPLPFAALSAVHARVLRAGSGWVVEDAGSTNGTWLDGARLPPAARRALAPGAELRLGNVGLRFEGAGPARAEAQGTASLARRLVDDLFATSGAPVLRLSPSRALPLAVAGRAYVVGRAETCSLSLAVEELSREHAAFVRREDAVVVRDLGSKNGVVVAGARVVGERALSDGDVVELGPVSLTLEDPASRYLRELAELPPQPAAPAPREVPADPPPSTPPQAQPRARASRLITAAAISVLVLLAAATVALFLPGR
jgi:pSer/pThr/pTyr-binding forkhead associated (FHA) protein